MTRALFEAIKMASSRSRKKTAVTLALILDQVEIDMTALVQRIAAKRRRARSRNDKPTSRAA